MKQLDPNSICDPYCQIGRLIVDISVIYRRDAGTGIQRVVRNVWPELRDYSQAWEVVPVFWADDGNFHSADVNFLDFAADEKAVDRPVFEARQNDVFLGLDFSPAILPRARRTIAYWKQLGMPVNLVVYDLLPVTNPHWFTRRGARNYRKWLTFLERYADRALCISESVATDLRAVLKARRWRYFWRRRHSAPIGVVRLGTELRARGKRPVQPPELDSVLGRPIILMVGTIEPRKGYDFALRVFDQLWTRSTLEPVVVIVGKAGWKTQDLQNRLETHRLAGTALFWLRDVDDEALAWLYANSATFFSASRAEGFGLPLVEAMGHGLPVIATDLPVFREFGSDGIVFFQKDDVDEATILLEQVLQGRGPAAVKSGRVSASWADTAADIFKQILPKGLVN